MSGLRELGEFGFIDQVGRLAGPAADEIIAAIGDDCAVIDSGGPEKLLVTTDAALEGRHFDLTWMTAFEAGQRTAAGAISDIAAMGGRPFACLCTAAIPATADADVALELMRGVADTARRYGAPLIGGDTIGAFERLMIDLVVLGWAKAPWRRSGAQVGDRLLLTGNIGQAGAALELLTRDPQRILEPRFAELRARLVDPMPRLAEAGVLAPSGLVHAAIDVSDGLYQDAGHIARESGVAIGIEVSRLPVADSCRQAAELFKHDALWWAATGGEEYELLLAVSKSDVPEVLSLAQDSGLAPLTQIGFVQAGKGVVLAREDGSHVELERGGWDHFRTQE